MIVRILVPNLVSRYARSFRALSIMLLLVLIALIAVDEWETVQDIYIEATVLGTIFTLFAVAAGWTVGHLPGAKSDDRFVFAIEFAVRNVGAAALIASSTLGRPEFLAFGALFVVLQFPLIGLLLKLRLLVRGCYRSF